MRKFLLATSAAALALTFSGQAHAEPDKIPVAATTVAPPETTTADGLVFSKDADQAKPIEQRRRPSRRKPSRTAKPAEQAAAGHGCPDASTPKTPRSPTGSRSGREQAPAVRAAGAGSRRRAGVLHAPATSRRSGSRPASRAPRAEQAAAFLQGVAADGLDPADYPTPGFGNADPAKLAADELALTNSVVTFARHASIGRVAFTRVSGAVYFDQKAPNAADVLGKLAEQHRRPRHARRLQSAGAGIQGAQGRSSPRSAAARAPSPKPSCEAAPSRRRRRRKQGQVEEGAKTPKAKAQDGQAEDRERRHHHRQHGALALDAARSRRDLCDGQHPGLHAEGGAGRQDRVVDQDRGRQARRARHAAAHRDDEVHHRQSDLERAAVDHPQRIPAGAGARSGRAGAHRAAGRPQQGRLDPHLPAAGRAQCARPHPLQFPEPLPGLSARHAGQEAVRARRARLQPRLHARAEPGSVCRGAAGRLAAGGRLHRRAHPLDVRHKRAHHHLQAADPGLHHLPDRVRRRRRQAADPRRHLWPRQATCSPCCTATAASPTSRSRATTTPAASR